MSRKRVAFESESGLGLEPRREKKKGVGADQRMHDIDEDGEGEEASIEIKLDMEDLPWNGASKGIDLGNMVHLSKRKRVETPRTESTPDSSSSSSSSSSASVSSNKTADTVSQLLNSFRNGSHIDDLDTIRFARPGTHLREEKGYWDTNDVHDYCEPIPEFNRPRQAALAESARPVDMEVDSEAKSPGSGKPAKSNTPRSKAEKPAKQSARARGLGEEKVERDDVPEEEEWTGLDELCQNLLDCTLEHEEEVRLSRTPIPKMQASNSRLNTSALSAGELRERAIRKALDSMGLARTKQQKQFHEAAIMSCLSAIHGTELESKKARIMKKHGINEIRHEVLVMTPRRYGKTTMVAMIAAALLVCVPGIRIVIFSTGRRASQALMDLIVKFVCMLPGAQSRICKKNQETLGVAARPVGGGGLMSESAKLLATDPDTSVLMSFPANENGEFGRPVCWFALFCCCLSVCVFTSPPASQSVSTNSPPQTNRCVQTVLGFVATV